jgi:thiol-disulfide isomerase/thioredoxin
MRWTLCLLLLLVGCVDHSETANKFNSTRTVDVSVKEKKVRVLYFYADWCEPCRRMKLSWADKEVKKTLEKYVDPAPKKLDVDQPDGMKEARRYNITAIPAVVITDLKGTKLKKSEGYLTAKELNKLLSDYYSGVFLATHCLDSKNCNHSGSLCKLLSFW